MLKKLFFAKNNQQKGFSLLEALIAMFMLSSAFLLNFQFLLMLKLQNIEQEIETGAVALSKEILDDLRTQDTLNPGTTTQTGISKLGHNYDTTVYICTQTPTVDNQNAVTTCPNTVDPLNPLRYVVLKIDRNNETVYTIQSVFTQVS